MVKTIIQWLFWQMLPLRYNSLLVGMMIILASQFPFSMKKLLKSSVCTKQQQHFPTFGEKHCVGQGISQNYYSTSFILVLYISIYTFDPYQKVAAAAIRILHLAIWHILIIFGWDVRTYCISDRSKLVPQPFLYSNSIKAPTVHIYLQMNENSRPTLSCLPG